MVHRSGRASSCNDRLGAEGVRERGSLLCIVCTRATGVPLRGAAAAIFCERELLPAERGALCWRCNKLDDNTDTSSSAAADDRAAARAADATELLDRRLPDDGGAGSIEGDKIWRMFERTKSCYKKHTQA